MQVNDKIFQDKLQNSDDPQLKAAVAMRDELKQALDDDDPGMRAALQERELRGEKVQWDEALDNAQLAAEEEEKRKQDRREKRRVQQQKRRSNNRGGLHRSH